jgi:serine phosphatase RsbU (regulator of sigma subunit)/CHASE1-domain containing sensor protein
MERTKEVLRRRFGRPAIGPSAPPRRGSFTPTVAVMVTVLVVGGLLAAVMVSERESDQREHAIERMDAGATAQIEEVISRTESRLAAAAGIVGVDGTVEAVQFNAFADGLVSVPSVAASAFSVVVNDEDREAFEEDHGFPIVDRAADGTFDPAPPRQMYIPIIAAAPANGATSRLLGFDYLHEPATAAAFGEAWNMRDPVVSEPFRLALGVPGFVVVQALYEHGTDVEPTPERRARVVGFISVGYNTEVLVGELAEQIGAPVTRLEIDGHIVHRDDGLDDATHSVTADALGTPWSVSFVPDVPGRSWRPLGILAATLFAAALAIEFARRSWRYERELEHWADASARQERRTESLRRLTAEITSSDDVPTVATRALEHGLEVAQATWGRIVVGQNGGSKPTFVESGTAPAGAEPDVVGTDVDAVTGTDADIANDGGGVSVERLRSGGHDHGTITLAPPNDTLDVEGRRLREMFIGLTAAALARTKQRQADRDLAETLQSMLLPRLPSHLDGAALCGVYLPRAAAVGGDWYDGFLTEVGFKFVVGDIVGMGPRAAGAMGNLRIATHMVSDHRLPESVLDAFDAVAIDSDDVFLATSAVVVADREAKVIRSSLAGHLPPLTISPRGEIAWLDVGKGLPLGVDRAGGRIHASTAWEEPVRLVMYTDGLVERRGEPLSAGLERLAESAVRHRGLPLDDFCDAIIGDLIPGSLRTDDVAVLAVDLPAP